MQRKHKTYMWIGLALLALIYFAYPGKSYNHYLAAAYIAEGLSLGQGVKVQLLQQFQMTGQFPENNQDAGLPPKTSIQGKAVRSIEVSRGGVITITFNGKVKEGSSLILIPDLSDSRSLSVNWSCQTNTLEPRYFENLGQACLYTPPDRTDQLRAAIINGDIDALGKAIKKGADINTSLFGQRPIMLAVDARRLDMVKALLAAGVDTNIVSTLYDGYSPLILAARHSSIDIIQTLLANGAQVDLKDVQGKTALMHAVEQSSHATVSLLLQHGANPGLKDRRGKTVLSYAKRKGQSSQSYLLISAALENGRPITSSGAAVGNVSGLMNVIINGDSAGALALIKTTMAINERNSRGKTALHYAVQHQQHDVIDALLAHGAIVDVTDIDLTTPLMLAAINCDPQSTVSLLAYSPDLNLQNKYQESALTEAAKIGCDAVLSHLLTQKSIATDSLNSALVASLEADTLTNRLDIVKQLLAAGADANASDRLKQPVLSLAISKRYRDSAVYLIEQGATPNSHNAYTDAPLMMAAKSGQGEVVNALILRGVSVDTVDPQGRTALMYAVEQKNQSLVRSLLNARANKDIMDRRGNTALSIATDKYYTTIAAMLRE